MFEIKRRILVASTRGYELEAAYQQEDLHKSAENSGINGVKVGDKK